MATIEEYWDDCVKKGFKREYNGCKTIYTIPSDMGEGGFEIWGKTDYAMVTFLDLTLYKPMVMIENVNEKYLQFSQFYTGKAEFYQKRSDVFPIENGLNFLVHNNGIFGYKRVESGIRLVDVGIFYRNSFFETLPFPLPEDFWETTANVLNDGIVSIPQITSICEQLRYCRLEGAALDIFVYAKAFEAFSIILDYVYENRQKPPVHISQTDKKLFDNIKLILNKNFVNPPSINELSLIAGMNKRKLMCGFKYLNGMTIFRYIKCIRMEKAAELLRDHNSNVLDIAIAVGYHGDGHFQQSFKEIYGVSPKEFRKSMIQQ